MDERDVEGADLATLAFRLDQPFAGQRPPAQHHVVEGHRAGRDGEASASAESLVELDSNLRVTNLHGLLSLQPVSAVSVPSNPSDQLGAGGFVHDTQITLARAMRGGRTTTHDARQQFG
jgi:hypothetical protein